MVGRKLYTQGVGGQARALGPLAHQANVGRHHLEREHQARLDETDHAAEAALDVLGALVAQVPEDAFDGAAPSERVDPFLRSPLVSLTKLRQHGSGDDDRRLPAALGRRDERSGILDHRSVRRVVLGQWAEFALELARLTRADPLGLERVGLRGDVLIEHERVLLELRVADEELFERVGVALVTQPFFVGGPLLQRADLEVGWKRVIE